MRLFLNLKIRFGDLIVSTNVHVCKVLQSATGELHLQLLVCTGHAYVTSLVEPAHGEAWSLEKDFKNLLEKLLSGRS